MNHPHVRSKVTLYASCPQSVDVDGASYVRKVRAVAALSEALGCSGILIFTDNRLVDPWPIAQTIVEATTRLCPLVAVQPIYTHPYTVAKMIASFGYLFGRSVHLNLVAGGFKNDLTALGDTTPHDARYERLMEYATVVKRLLGREGPVSMEGRFYRVADLRLVPKLPERLLPRLFVSGSSEASLSAAGRLEATAVRYPKPPDEERGMQGLAIPFCVRLGIVARPSDDEAWRVARVRFPDDRKGQITHHVAKQTSDSVWHQELSRLETKPASERPTYWLGPFQNYQAFCPYLVGSYERTASVLAEYIALGCQTFIVDVPLDAEDLVHTMTAFQTAGAEVTG